MEYDLSRKVYGDVILSEIVGAEPPAHPNLEEKLEDEFSSMVDQLESKSVEEINEFRTQQLKHERIVNSRPGAMALDQEKIRMYITYHQRLLNLIEQILKGKSQ